MAAHSSILARKIPWTEEPGRLQSKGLHRVRHNWAIEHTHTHIHTHPYYQLCESNLFISLRPGSSTVREDHCSLPKRGARGWNEMELVKCLVRTGWVAPTAGSNITIPRSIVLSHFSRVWLFVTPWTSLPGSSSMGFSGQEYLSVLPFPSPDYVPNPGIEPVSSTLAGMFFTTRATWEAP